MLPCEELWKIEKELKKYSIYLLDDDLKDRDFEFFIFIDPDNPKYRPPFLKELFNIINHKSNGREFVVPKHKEELKKWTGTKNDNDPCLTPLNWLKIAIERYPYRLIVITNNIPKGEGKKIEFINKRICFIEKKNFFDRNYDAYGNLFLSLYFIWIDHILTNIRSKHVKDIILLYIIDIEKSCPYIPETLPNIDKKYLKNKNDSEKGTQTNTLKIIIKISIDNKEVININEEYNLPKDYLLIFLNRHKNFYRIDNNNKLRTDYLNYKEKLIYSENISGGLSFFNQIQESIDEPSKYSSKIFLIRYIENSLLRIGICDERFQEWWGLKDNNKAGSIVQSRIMPFYIEDKSKYAQKPLNGNIFYTIMMDEELQNNPQEGDLKNIWSLNNDGKIDFLIIHQGILDEWQEKDKSKENLTKRILKIKDQIPFVIITSGRGMPDNLPYGVKFIPFSNIEACMVGDYFEKLTLLRQLLKLI